METTHYLFQSPYHSQIQIGKAQSVATEQSSSSESELIKSTNKTATEASLSKSTQTKETPLKVEGSLDFYV